MGTRNYTIDDGLYVRLKMKCAYKEVSISSVLRDLIKNYVNEDVEAMERHIGIKSEDNPETEQTEKSDQKNLNF